MSITVVLADDQALVRTGFRMILAETDDIEVVGEAGDGDEAVRVAAAAGPDVVLMDVRMPGTDGIAATRRIRAAEPAPRVLILTTFDLDEYVYAALHAGASGFLLKSTEPAELVSAIRVIAAGDALLAPSVTRRLVEEFTRRPVPRARQAAPDPAPAPVRAPAIGLAGITGREREVLALIASGLSNSEIAARLCISEATAKTHVGHLLTKLNARDRVHLVILAFQAGLVSAAPVGPGGRPSWNPPAA